MKSIRLIAALLVPLSLSATGFKNYEVGPRATALAGAFVAGFCDPASIFYNPAAITGLEGTQFHLGGSFTSRSYSFSSPDFGGLAFDSERASFPLPSFAVTRRINRFLWAGLGFHASSSHEIAWPAGRFNPLVYDARRLSFRSWRLTPALAVKLSDRLSIGAQLGVNFASGEFVTHLDYDMLVLPLTNGVVQDPQDFILALEDCRSTYLTYGLGVQWRIAPSLHFGFAAEGGRGGVYDAGSLVFREPDTPFEDVNAYLDGIFLDSPEQKARATINDIVTFKWGLAWKPGGRLTVEADVYLPVWEMFDTVSVRFEKPMSAGTFRLEETEGDFSWKHPLSLRVGAEYAASDRVALRLGAFREPSPVQDDQFSPAFPFTTQSGVSAGAGWRFKSDWAFDVAYRVLAVSGRSVANDRLRLNGLANMKFGARVEHLFSAGLSCRF